MLTPDKIIEIFVEVDDFCKESDHTIKKYRVEANTYRNRNRSASLSDSGTITILIAFHTGHFTNLKHFYIGHICPYYKDYFPGLVSYDRFVELQQRVAVPMMLFLKTHCLGSSRGINFIDSTISKYVITGASMITRSLQQWQKEGNVPLAGSMVLNCT